MLPMLLNLNWLDYCLISFIAFSLFMGFLRGLVQELSSLANWFLGLWWGAVFYETASEQLPDIVQPIEVRYILGFFMAFAVVLVAVTLLSKALRWLVRSIGLKGPDSILGVCFGGLRGILFVALFIVVAKSSSFQHSNAWQYSVLVHHFAPLESWLKSYLPYDFNTSLTS